MSLPEDIATSLRALPLCHEFTDAELAGFADLLDPITAPKGTIIVRQDDPGDSMYLVISGQLRVVHRHGGKFFELSVLRAGDFFGELALVDEGPRSADVEALEDTHLLMITQAMVRALAGVYPGAAFKLLVAVGRVLVARMRASNQKYIDSLLLASGGKD